jgi:hypothetical protein
MENPVLIVQHSLTMATYLIYIVLRRILANTNRLYEWAVFAIFSIHITVSSLINSRVLPERITGVNPLTTASTN